MKAAIASRFQAAYIEVPRAFIRRDTVTSFDLYLRNGARYVLYHAANTQFDLAAERRIQQSNVSSFFIRATDRQRLQMYLIQHLRNALSSSIPPDIRAQILFEAGGGAVESLIGQPDDRATLNTATDIALLTMEQVISEQGVLPALIALGHIGQTTVTHAVQCCVLVSALGYRVGLSANDLGALAVAGLLHDVGLARLDPALGRRDESALDDVERAMYERHPVLGAEIIAAGNLRREAADIVRQHHERIDGSGYPAGLSGQNILAGSRAVAIVDTYERLVNGAIRRLTPFHALSRIRFRMQRDFDPTLLMEFIHLLGSIETSPRRHARRLLAG